MTRGSLGVLIGLACGGPLSSSAVAASDAPTLPTVAVEVQGVRHPRDPRWVVGSFTYDGRNYEFVTRRSGDRLLYIWRDLELPCGGVSESRDPATQIVLDDCVPSREFVVTLHASPRRASFGRGIPGRWPAAWLREQWEFEMTWSDNGSSLRAL